MGGCPGPFWMERSVEVKATNRKIIEMSFLITFRFSVLLLPCLLEPETGPRDSRSLYEQRKAPSPPTPLPRWGEVSQRFFVFVVRKST